MGQGDVTIAGGGEAAGTACRNGSELGDGSAGIDREVAGRGGAHGKTSVCDDAQVAKQAVSTDIAECSSNTRYATSTVRRLVQGSAWKTLLTLVLNTIVVRVIETTRGVCQRAAVTTHACTAAVAGSRCDTSAPSQSFDLPQDHGKLRRQTDAATCAPLSPITSPTATTASTTITRVIKERVLNGRVIRVRTKLTRVTTTATHTAVTTSPSGTTCPANRANQGARVHHDATVAGIDRHQTGIATSTTGATETTRAAGATNATGTAVHIDVVITAATLPAHTRCAAGTASTTTRLNTG